MEVGEEEEKGKGKRGKGENPGTHRKGVLCSANQPFPK